MARKFVPNNAGLYALRSDPAIRRDLERRAQAVADASNASSGGTGYKTSSVQGAKRPQGRWRTTVMTTDYKSQRDNRKNNTLLNNIDKARGDKR